jgi:hypothetical protein
VSLKSLTIGIAVAAMVSAAAAGVTSVASAAPVATPATVAAGVGAPLPLDPAADVPTADELTGILTQLADPGVPFGSKGNLVQGGVGFFEGRTADHLLQNANAKGYLPLSFQIGNIVPAGPGAATATVTVSGPQLAPNTQTVTFVDQGGWKLSRSSATSLLQSALGSGANG